MQVSDACGIRPTGLLCNPVFLCGGAWGRMCRDPVCNTGSDRFAIRRIDMGSDRFAIRPRRGCAALWAFSGGGKKKNGDAREEEGAAVLFQHQGKGGGEPLVRQVGLGREEKRPGRKSRGDIREEEDATAFDRPSREEKKGPDLKNGLS